MWDVSLALTTRKKAYIGNEQVSLPTFGNVTNIVQPAVKPMNTRNPSKCINEAS